MSILHRAGVPTSVLFYLLLITMKWLVLTEAMLPACSKANEGKRTLYRKVSGDDGLLICLKNNGQYAWKFLDGSTSLGEKFNPAKDCSDVVDKISDAKDGFYWIKQNNGKLSKAWCDVHTDGGGFMLIGMTDSPVTWSIPSNDTPVDPMGPPHWSSQFGDVKLQEFAIQISTTKGFKDTKTHWSYRLETNRALGSLFGAGSGVCTDIHSGIGNIAYVKDILTETVVNTNFSCSKFGHHVDKNIGWGRMNSCFRKKCPNGYAFIKGFPFKLDSHGSFSYSASSTLSGVTHDATAFVGCDGSKCCACFGPKGGRAHYCSKKCTAINGGTILTSQVYVWFWIRTRMPERLWKRCMEFKTKTVSGKFETYFIDRKTGVTHKGSCSQQFQTFLNEGTLTVKNKESLDTLPSVPGLLLYRKDNKKLYVNKGNTWDAIGSEKETENVRTQMKHLKVNLQNKNSQQDTNVQNLETKLQNKNSKQDTRVQKLETKLQNKNSKQDARVQNLETKLQSKNSQQDTKVQKLETKLQNKNSQQDAKVQNLETNLKNENSQQDARIQTLKTNLKNTNSQQNGRIQTLETKVQSLENTLETKIKMVQARLNRKANYGSNVNPAKSCKDILKADKFVASGTYWIQPVSNKQFKVYCDMETHGGGWTLVYSYTFTNYNSFTSSSNAVTPRPNWPVSGANVPISTTPPLSESSRGAVDYSLWKEIGQDIMIKSNINDWIVCKPNGGSLVTKKDGAVSCQNIKNVATACHGVVPNRVLWYSDTPGFLASSDYYIFEASSGSYYPAHDPCGKSKGNQKKGVSNPGGQIYLR